MGRKKVIKEIVLNSDTEGDIEQMPDSKPGQPASQPHAPQTAQQPQIQQILQVPAGAVLPQSGENAQHDQPEVQPETQPSKQAQQSPAAPVKPKKRKSTGKNAAVSKQDPEYKAAMMAKRAQAMTQAKMRKKIELELAEKKERELEEDRRVEEKIKKIMAAELRSKGFSAYTPKNQLKSSSSRMPQRIRKEQAPIYEESSSGYSTGDTYSDPESPLAHRNGPAHVQRSIRKPAPVYAPTPSEIEADRLYNQIFKRP